MNPKNTSLLFFITLLQFHILAQDSTQKLKSQNPITVTAYKFATPTRNVPFTLKKIENTNWNTNAPTMAEVLSNSGEVLVQKSQAGGGSPIIRGFEASRVLLMVDGIRMNNAIYRAGHLQNIITVDANTINNVDILYGPASTQYGSDALGGVVAMYTIKPLLGSVNNTAVKVAANTRYSSALQEGMINAMVNIGGAKWAALTSLTTSTFGNTMQGNNRKSDNPNFGKKSFQVFTIGGNDYIQANPNPNKQVETNYKQLDLMQKVLYTPNVNTEHILNLQYSNSTNVPRYDRLTELNGDLPRFAQWYYGHQKRALAAYHHNKTYNRGNIVKLQQTIAYQNIEESRYDRRFGNKNGNTRIEKLNILSYTNDAQLRTKKNVQQHVGVEMQMNNINSTAYSQNIVTGLRQNNINTRYPNGKNTYNFIAAYLQHLQQLNANTTLNVGLRYTYNILQVNFADNTVMQFPFTSASQKNGAVSGNLGITHNTASNLKLAAVINTGFRTPNIDDMGKVFDSRAGILIVPNTALKPEQTYNGEINVTQTLSKANFGASVFYTLFKNAIIVDSFSLNGQRKVMYQNVNSFVLASQNKNQAYLYGASAFANIQLQPNTQLQGTITYTYGRVNTATTVPLDHIPPIYGRLGVTHTYKKCNLQLFTLFNGAKKLANYSPSGEDNLQYATPTGMPSWYTINLNSTIPITNKINLLVGVDNISDKNYRVFASGLSAPGRNVIIGLRSSL